MKINIERFKNIKNIELDLNKVNLLVGGNNSGKSSILQAIQFGVSIAQTVSMQKNTYWESNRLSTSIGQNDFIYTPLKDVMSLALGGRLKEAVDEAIRILYFHESKECYISIRRGKNKNILLELVGEDLGKKLQSISNPFCSLVTGLAGIPGSEEYKTILLVNKAAARGDSNSVFRNILLLLKKNVDKWNKFIKHLNNIFSDVNIEISFDEHKDEVIQCNVVLNGLMLPIDSCGTGVLQAIQIFSYTCLFEPKLLVLDEPDSHLHPNNQRLLAIELKKIADEGIFLLISTHSKHIVKSLIDDAKLFWIKNGMLMEEKDNYTVESLMEIGALNEGENIQQVKYIILTEDSNKDLMQLILSSNEFEKDDFEILSYNGCTNISFAKSFINHLRRTNSEAKYIVHRDKDFLGDSDIDEYKRKLTESSIYPLIPLDNDLESLLTKSSHIAEACNITLEVAEDIRKVCIKNKKEDMIAKYINTIITNRNRSGEKNINTGEIGGKAAVEYETNPEKYLHGKILLGAIRDELKKRDISDSLMKESTYLKLDFLRRLKDS